MNLQWWCLNCNKRGNVAIPQSGRLPLGSIYVQIGNDHGGNPMALSISFVAGDPATIRLEEGIGLVLESERADGFRDFEVRHVQ